MPRFHRSRSLRRAIAMLAALAALSSVAFAQNSAQGSITVNGAKTDLSYAYAITKPSLSDKKPETTLILADKPLSAKAVTDSFDRMRARSKDEIRMLELTFDDSKQLTSLQFQIEPMNGGGYSTAYKVKMDTFSDKAMKGRLYTEGEETLFKDRFRFDVSFDVVMTVPRAADFTGKAAWNTPQGKAVAEYLRAARAGDKAALKRVIVAERAKDLDGPQAADILQFLKLSADPKTAEFDSLTVDGDSAEANVAERTKNGASSSRYKLKLISGAWKIDP